MHFEMVLGRLRERGWSLGFQRKDEYIEKLQGLVKKGGSREEQLIEKLLLNALIEARSCERFRLLWKEIADKALSDFYYELMVSEAGHYKLFLSLAKEYHDPVEVEHRWRKLLAGEAEVMKELALREDRLH